MAMLWSFQGRDTKLERIWLKINCSQVKLLDVGNGVLRCQKMQKIQLLKSIFYVKNHPNHSVFCFFIEEYEFGGTFFAVDIFDDTNF